MADPLGSLEKIVKLALRIKEAVDTVRQNKEECQQITKQVLRISAILSHELEMRISGGPEICGALDDLEDALQHAHTLVTACCQERTIVCLYCTAGKQAKKLRWAQDDIGQKIYVLNLALNIRTTSIIMTSIRIQQDVPPPLALQDIGVTMTAPAPVEPPDLPLPQVAPTPTAPPPPTLSTAIRNELARATIRLAGKAVEHAMFVTDSGMQGASLGTKMQEADSTDIIQYITPASCGDQGLQKFNFSKLEAATGYFSVENMVDSGAFVTVYKGVLNDGFMVAVKKFQHPYVLSAGNIDELHLVSKLKHKNIVKLIGYSVEDAKVGAKENKEASYLLVEEYMPNGSLEKIINGLGLYWPSRFHIIQGVGHGLCYLHEQDIIHLDEPSNILLDFDMIPKITDFGIAKKLIHNRGDIYSDMGTIAGILGYMPPEYISNGTLSKKHDVYSFGVTVLETVSSMSRSERAIGQTSLEWAWEARQAGGVIKLLDPSLFDEVQIKEIERCVEVGLLCTQFDPTDRPDMLAALEMLRGERALRTPVRPGHTREPGRWFGRWG